MNRAQTGPSFYSPDKGGVSGGGVWEGFCCGEIPISSPELQPQSLPHILIFYLLLLQPQLLPISFLLLRQPQPRLVPLYFLHYKWYGWLVYLGCLRGLGVYHPPHLHHNNPSTPTTHLHNLAKPEPQVANEVIRRRSSGKWSRPPP